MIRGTWVHLYNPWVIIQVCGNVFFCRKFKRTLTDIFIYSGPLPPGRLGRSCQTAFKQVNNTIALLVERRIRDQKEDRGYDPPEGAAGREFSPPDSTLRADSCSMSFPPPCYSSGTLKIPIILPKVQVPGYRQTRIHS